MKIVKLLSFVLVMNGAILSSTALLAHTELTEAMPANGAVMHQGPEHVSLNFTEEVRLLQLSVTDSTGHAVEIGFTPRANEEKVFSLMLPALTADTYTVKWMVMGDDSHRVEGEFSFTVDPTATEMMGGHAEMPDHHDAH
tara:strand:- start:1523 stop:1942 length:420 start_codon:yes stop_codon:yes gene_type:complete